MAVAKLPLLGGVALTAAAIPTGLYVGSTIAKPEETPTPTAPALVSLKKAGDFQVANDPSKFGERFSYFFLSHTKTENDSEWNKRAEALKSVDNLEDQGFFKAIKANATGATLKGKCQSAYNENLPDATAGHSGKWKEVWTHCSLVGGKPTTIDESKSDLGSITGANAETGLASSSDSKWGESLKASALSTYDPKNQKFWDLRNEEFEAAVANPAPATDAYFKKTENKTIQTLCRELYQTNKNGQTKPSETDVKKWCSIDKTTG